MYALLAAQTPVPELHVRTFASVVVSLLLFSLFLCACPAQGQLFQNPRLLKTDVVPEGVTAADLNGDGLPDLLYSGTYGFGDSVPLHSLLTDGKGGYQPGPDILLPSGYIPICQSGDVNGDGKIDLICSGDEIRAAIAVLLGNGDGTFAPAILVPVPPLMSQLCTASNVSAVGDLNNDGHPDVVVTCEIGDLIVPMLGDGSGHFAAAAAIYAYGTHIRLADLNGDGKVDMVAQGVFATRQTEVLLGRGDGTFDDGGIWYSNYESVLGDIDGDGHLDLIGGGSGVIRIFRGHSDGTFDNEPTQVIDYNNGALFDDLGRGVYNYPLACVDLNGDGHPDLVALGGNGMTVFPGKGNLQFGTPRSFPEEQATTYGVLNGEILLDVNGDGLPDYVALAATGLSISYGRSDGSFVSGQAYLSGGRVTDLALADFDEDGLPDAVTAGDQQMYLSLGKADGSFAEAKPLPPVSPPMRGTVTEGWTNVMHGDVNGDGHQDLVAIGAAPDGTAQLSVLLGHGDGSFDPPVTVQPMVESQLSAVLDLNGDGRADLVLRSGFTLTVLLGQRDGSFQSVAAGTLTVPDSDYPSLTLALSDANGDGLPDLVYGTTNNLAVAAGRGDGSFGAPVFYPLPMPSAVLYRQAGSVAIGDFDGDGIPDVTVLSTYTGPGQNDYGKAQLFTFYGAGARGVLDANSFTTGVAGPISNQDYRAVYAADVDGDGRADVIAENNSSQAIPLTVEVSQGRADRTLGAPVDYVDGSGQAALAFADLNGDGRADLIKANTFGNAFTVLLSTQGLQPAGTLTASPNPVLLGGALTLTAQVTADGQSGPLGGQVTFAADGKTIGSAALANGSASIAAPPNLSIGNHQLTAVTSILKDQQGSYAPVSMAIAVSVAPLPVAVTVTSSGNPVLANQSTTFSVQVGNGSDAPAGSPRPSGQVTVQVDGTTIGSGSSDGTSAFSFTVPYTTSIVGTHVVAVTYPGDAAHLAGSASLQQVVAAIPVIVSLTSSVNPVIVTQGTTFSVQVRNGNGVPAGSPSPKGQVTVQVDGTTVGSGSSDGMSAFSFTLPYTSSVVGTHSVTATYPGDTAHLAGSANLQQVVAPVPGSFNLTASPAAVSVSAGKAASVLITVSSVDGFFGPVALKYSSLPPSVTGSLDQATLTVVAGGKATATLSFSETAAARSQPLQVRSTSKTFVGFATMLLLAYPIKRRKSVRILASIFALSCLGVGLTGCGTHPRPVGGENPPVTYSVSITGIGAGTQPTQSTAIALTVVP